MTERIVVSCRMNGEEVSRPETRYLDRARALTQHAEALGATLAAWSATTLAFAWDTDSLEEAIDFVTEANGAAEKPVWACAMARGDLVALADTGGGRADLAWGEPLVAAVVLARAAKAGEVLVEASFQGLGDLVTTGKRVAHDGEKRVRGVRIDPRQPWKRDVGAAVAHLVSSPFVGRPDARTFLARPGVVHVVRADPGQGGTRMLAELARAVAPGPCIVVTPAGGSVEPLGALRRALGRALATRPYPDDPELGPALDMFLGGIGASIEQASALIAALLRPLAPADPPGALLLDDAGEIDAESLEACAHVVAWMASSSFHVFVRIDATDQVPAALAALPQGQEIDLAPLDRDAALAVAKCATAGALDDRAARRVVRRAGLAPLAIGEALALGLTRGDLCWLADRVSLRTRAAFAGKPCNASYWIAKRAKATAPDERGVLATLALFGGEAPLEAVRDALRIVEPGIAVDDEVKKLVAARWLVPTQPGWIALPSRTHRDTIADLLDETPRRILHGAIADVLEHSEGELGCAEAADHAAKAGEGERAARLALRAARAAARAGMSKSANRLLTLARLADPKCEPLTRQALLTSLPPPIPLPSGPPSRRAPVPSPPASAARAAQDDVPTDRVSAVNVADAARVLAASGGDRAAPPATPPPREVPDSDFPTVINAPAFSDERSIPLPEEPPERPTMPDPVPDYVLQPPPAAPRVGARWTPPSAPRPEPSLPKPQAPLPLRPSVQGMPAARAAEGAKKPIVVGRASVQIAAVRPPVPAPRVAVREQTSLSDPEAVGVDALLAKSPPVVAAPAAAPPPPPELSANGDLTASAVSRMVDLARAALVAGDTEGLERWTEGLRAAGEHDRLAERIGAIARLTRGQVGEALRSLRALRDGADPSSPPARAQASLALGLGLAAANRADEALLAGLDALARAREGTDPRATGACLAFLAKLYGRADRAEDAAALVAASKR